ncbi:group II truncated hemoglobin [soil metagenome]
MARTINVLLCGANARYTPVMTPYDELGGRDSVLALAERFYDVMSESEPALAAIHECSPSGVVARGPRDRFALFLLGWLGGPDDYVKTHGHPRLRMRHGRVEVSLAMRDAWLRCMQTALNDRKVTGEVRTYLDGRFADVADFMRNVEG